MRRGALRLKTKIQLDAHFFVYDEFFTIGGPFVLKSLTETGVQFQSPDASISIYASPVSQIRFEANGLSLWTSHESLKSVHHFFQPQKERRALAELAAFSLPRDIVWVVSTFLKNK
jgi:hypothetical protein